MAEIMGKVEGGTVINVEIIGSGPPGKDGYTPVKGVDYFDGEKGDPGDDGYTPQKGIDYFTPEDIAEFKASVTPVKGVDYFDGQKGDPGEKGDPGKDGYTPQKGIDYFDGKDGYTPVKGIDYFDGNNGYTPQKGIDYFDGEKGDKGDDYTLTSADRSEIAGIVETDIEPTLTGIRETAEQAETIARGKATGYVFDTYADLETAIADAEFVAELVLGDNLYIRATDVPDYWWDGTQIQPLEAEKPDLTGFVTAEDVATMIDTALGVIENGAY